MANHVYRGSQSLLDVQGEENTPAAKDQELVATLSVESEQQEEQQEQKLAALLTVEETRQTDEEQQRLVALLDVQETRGEDTRTQEVIALLDVLDEVPPIPVNPPQGLQAELGLIYLYNPDAANSLIQELNLTIEEVNDAVQDITQLTVDAMKIKPYSLLGEPIAQNTPCTFDGCIYVAVATIAQKDPVFNPAQWAKVGTADYNKLYNKPDFITLSDLSCTATGLTYNQETGVLSLTSGYVIPTVTKISQIDTGIATNATNLTLETQQREEAVSNANAKINALETGLTAETTDRVAADSSMANNISSLNGRLVAHETNHNNPHQVTKAQIGLGNVNNTADLDKPISTATQQALNTLSGRIGTADAKFDDYRTAEQQDIIDNQIRIEISNVSQAVTLEEAARLSADATINNKINSIEEVIPSSATASNMLADRAFVNSSINNMAAYYITASASGNAFGDHARLISGPWYFQGELRTPTLNDYALVIEDETHDNKSARYLYDGAQWAFQYTLNNTEFTQDQINAIDSTITKGKVDDYDAHIIDYSNPHNVTKAQVGLSNVDNTSDLNKPVSTATQQALAQKQDIINDLATIRAGAALGATSVQPADLAAYETTAHASATYQLKGDYVTTSAMNVALAGKQNVLTAGTGVTIENDVISVTFPGTIAWGNITGNINNQTDLKNALNYKQDKLTAGTNITIDENNVISSTGGGSGLPDQTDNAGKFLTTNGTDASWGNLKITSTQVIVGTTWNVAPYTVLVGVNSYSWTTSANYGVAVGYTAACYTYSVAVGANSIASGDYSIAIGYHATAPGNNSITIGAEAHSGARNSVCIGYDAETTSNAQNAIQIGSGVNRVANTLMVANGNGNFEMMSADGTIPEARLADTTSATEGQVLTLDANGNAKWEDASSGGSYHPDLFDFKWADHILNDVQWLRADTFSWQSGSVYESAYQHLVDDIDGKTLQSETIGSTTIQFYLADDGHKICPASEENNVMDIYNTTGVAWYYIIDTTNERFKLPRTKFGVTGLRDAVGNYIAPGLPDHNHTISSAFSLQNYSAANPGAWDFIRPAAGNTITPTTNASDSNSIYGNSTTVQPPATEMYLYFYVGEFTQTALENTAGITAETLNDKVDKGHQVIAFQAPTAQNNYTWYRKYADGWVEQGGHNHAIQADNTDHSNYINFPVTMADTNYTTSVVLFGNHDLSIGIIPQGRLATTRLCIGGYYTATSDTRHTAVDWQVSGMAAQ